MSKLVLVFLTVVIFRSSFGQTGIYSFKIDSVTGSHQIDFSAFQGKKILIVNTATADSNSTQFAELEQLYQLYKDSLVVVAVSSNSFNTEPRTNGEIATYCAGQYNLHYTLSAKVEVVGNNADSLYKWLTQKSQNTMMNSTIHRAFQKYFINRQGKLVAAFDWRTSPMNQKLRHVIETL